LETLESHTELNEVNMADTSNSDIFVLWPNHYTEIPVWEGTLS